MLYASEELQESRASIGWMPLQLSNYQSFFVYELGVLNDNISHLAEVIVEMKATKTYNLHTRHDLRGILVRLGVPKN